jgi:hypothetical protein
VAGAGHTPDRQRRAMVNRRAAQKVLGARGRSGPHVPDQRRAGTAAAAQRSRWRSVVGAGYVQNVSGRAEPPQQHSRSSAGAAISRSRATGRHSECYKTPEQHSRSAGAAWRAVSAGAVTCRHQRRAGTAAARASELPRRASSSIWRIRSCESSHTRPRFTSGTCRASAFNPYPAQ